jgi:hypothetical protein
MRSGVRFLTTVAVLALVLGGAAHARAQQADSTYRVILYIAQDGGPTDVTITRLQEVWTAADGGARLQALLSASEVQRLEDVTIVPGRDTPALQLGNVTVRVQGVYKEPRRDAMFLRVEVDGGPETLVKELISRFDETIVLAYPLAEGNRTVVALLVPTNMGN